MSNTTIQVSESEARRRSATIAAAERVASDILKNAGVDSKSQALEPEIAQTTPEKYIPTPQKLEAFIALMQQGLSTAAALKQSGLAGADPSMSHVYDPSDPLAEVELEELFYRRAAAIKPPVISDSEYSRLLARTEQTQEDIAGTDNQQRLLKDGVASESQIYKLVDWLYFVRGLPLKAIAAAIKVPVQQVAIIKGELSNDFAKTIRAQNAEAYIGDLLRIKELLKADAMMRKSKLSATSTAHVQLNKFLWEIENGFVDRLQEIGIINKNLGRVDIHETWEVTIGPAGQPTNNKLQELSRSEFGSTIDVDSKLLPEGSQVSASSDKATSLQDSGYSEEQILGAVSRLEEKTTNLNPTIKVGYAE